MILSEHSLLLKQGSIVDAIIIEASSSNKNKIGKIQALMHET
jgi:hypothetical protein